MINSMTGFGYAEKEDSGVWIAVEIKSFNTRYLDIVILLPSSISVLEGRIREKLKFFERGKLEINVRMKDTENKLSISVDRAAAAAWRSSLKELAGLLGDTRQIPLALLANQDGVFKVERERDMEIYWTMLESLLHTAAIQVTDMREQEGEQLLEDIKEQLLAIEGSIENTSAQAPAIRSEVEERLRRGFVKILGDYIDEQRVLLEVAAWIARTNINEELVRLTAHISAFRKEISLAGAKGKKLDFLAQEMGREINTIGSKCSQANIAMEVVNMKDALEKLREQLRNVV
ncbi:Protein YicC [Olavius algarvensis spirochete endosymbiont]|uniref:YicC/YloC family endoribonuclease n=1 Tax=Olavius algarvensis spirochete endosymbiont TaxID=260710 RepID=UPI000F22B024|nr:YicC/YloC family endoribonuclease [Olavius algarvensis spirochete endosymbiont]VDA99986.1 Protein YicC [Olavius algarvensis spirochete endosymbiont]